MAPQLLDLKERGGAWAITVSTVQQVVVCRSFAFDRVLIANQIVGRTEMDYLFAELHRSPHLELYCLVDSVAGVARLAEAGQRYGINRRLNLLIEAGHANGRAGARTVGEAVLVARKAAEYGFSVRGVEGFEGFLETEQLVDAFLAFLIEIAKACAEEDLFVPSEPIILSAGGSIFYDRAADGLKAAGLGRESQLLIRSGCYLTHDSLMVENGYRAIRARAPTGALPDGNPVPALMVWASGLNDQHGYLSGPADSPIAVGDLIGFGISHPCTTFDKWQVLFVIDDDYTVIDAVKTFF